MFYKNVFEYSGYSILSEKIIQKQANIPHSSPKQIITQKNVELESLKLLEIQAAGVVTSTCLGRMNSKLLTVRSRLLEFDRNLISRILNVILITPPSIPTSPNSSYQPR